MGNWFGCSASGERLVSTVIWWKRRCSLIAILASPSTPHSAASSLLSISLLPKATTRLCRCCWRMEPT
ncbi:hypothetical protein LINPERHAP2_LOCUS13299 [Linum perenne]